MEYQLKATYKNILSYPFLTMFGESMHITWDLGRTVCVYICTKGSNLVSNISGKCSFLCNSSHSFQCYRLEFSPWQQDSRLKPLDETILYPPV